MDSNRDEDADEEDQEKIADTGCHLPRTLCLSGTLLLSSNHQPNDGEDDGETGESITPVSMVECHDWTARILQKIQVVRYGLRRISLFCEELANDATTLSSFVMNEILPKYCQKEMLTKQPSSTAISSPSMNHQDVYNMKKTVTTSSAVMSTVEIAMRCVELAVVCDSAIVDFFETLIRDLDIAMDPLLSEPTTSDDCNLNAYRKRMRIVDDMATMAARATNKLVNIASFNQYIIQDMEGLAGSYLTSDELVEASSMVQIELHVMHKKLATGILLVAQHVLQWKISQETKWTTG